MPNEKKVKTVEEPKTESKTVAAAAPEKAPAEVKKPAAKKTTAKKTTAKKATAKKPAAKKAAAGPTETIILQYFGGEWDVAALKERVLAAYAEQGHRPSRISSLTIYVKPEEHMVYYVVNGKVSGSVDFE